MAEEIERLRSSLEDADRLIKRKNEEIQAFGGVLAEANQKISERDAEIDQLESELATAKQKSCDLEAELKAQDAEVKKLTELVHRSPAQTENSPPTGKDLSEVEPADLLNQLKTRRKKSTATLSDIEAILEMIEKSCDDTSQEN